MCREGGVFRAKDDCRSFGRRLHSRRPRKPPALPAQTRSAALDRSGGGGGWVRRSNVRYCQSGPARPISIMSAAAHLAQLPVVQGDDYALATKSRAFCAAWVAMMVPKTSPCPMVAPAPGYTLPKMFAAVLPWA